MYQSKNPDLEIPFQKRAFYFQNCLDFDTAAKVMAVIPDEEGSDSAFKKIVKSVRSKIESLSVIFGRFAKQVKTLLNYEK